MPTCPAEKQDGSLCTRQGRPDLEGYCAQHYGIRQRAAASGTAPPQGGQQPGTGSNSLFLVGTVIGICAVLLLLGRYLDALPKQLEITAEISDSVDESGRIEWTVSGAVFKDGLPAKGAYVWALADYGNASFASGRTTTSEGKGDFTLKIVGPAKRESSITSTRWRIFTEQRGFLGVAHSGELVIEGKIQRRFGSGGAWMMAAVLGLFVFNIALLCVNPSNPIWLKRVYYFSVGMSFAFATAFLIGLYVAGNAITDVSSNDTMAYGFVTIHSGTYLDQAPPDRLFSFGLARTTADTSDAYSEADGGSRSASPSPVTTSFGAPMWVVNLSVLGMILLSIVTILDQLAKDIGDVPTTRTRKRQLVEYQFLTVFSPLSAVFVYQALLRLGAATEPVTVAVAALGAGTVLTALLAYSVRKARELMQKALGEKDDSPAPIGQEADRSRLTQRA